MFYLVSASAFASDGHRPPLQSGFRSLAVFAALVVAASAGNVTWDIAGGDSAVTGGSGNWNSVSNNWTADGGATNVAWNNSNNDTAVFGGTAGTVTLAGGMTVGGLTFNDNPNYDLTGGALTFGAAGAITSNVNAGIASVIAGGVALIKAGTGTLTLSNANVYTGATTINVGTLALNLGAAAADNVVPSASSLGFGGGGLSVIGTGGTTPRTQSFKGTTFNAGIATITPTLATASTTANVLTLDLGALARNAGGVGNIVFTSGNSTTTNTQINTSSGSANSLVTDANGVAFLTFGTSATSIRDWAVKDAGNTKILQAPSSGFYTAATATTLAGHADIGALNPILTGAVGDNPVASIRFDNASARTLTLNGATSTFSVGGILVTSNVGNLATVITGSATLRGPSGGVGDLVVNNWDATSTVTLSLPIGGSGGLTKGGSGTVILTGNNSHTGPTTITGGTLTVNNGGNLGATTGTLTNNGTLTFNNIGTLTVSNNIVGSGALNVNAGTVTLAGTNTYAGATNVTSSTLNLNGTHTSQSGVFALKGNSTVNLHAGATETVTGPYQFQLSNQAIGTTVMNVAGTLNVNTTNGMDSIIGGNLSGTNATLHVLSGGVVNVTGAGFRIANVGSATAAGTLTLDPGSAMTFDTIDSATGFTLQSNGSVTSATATVNLDGGVLTSGRRIRTTGTGVAIFNFNGGTLKSALASTNFLNVAQDSTGSLNALSRANVRNGGAVIDTNGCNITLSQVLAHSNISGDAAIDGGLTLTDTAASKGTLTLTGANTFTGPTIVNQGTLRIATAAAGMALTPNLKIMPLGDSITDGDPTGYRSPLYALLNPVAAGFQFVGDSTTNPGTLPTSPIDERYHSGHMSYSADDLDNNLDGLDTATYLLYGGASRDPHGGYWLVGGNGTGRAAIYPDAVLLLVGANDIGRVGMTGLQGRFEALLTKITTLRPAARVFFAKITPFTGQEANVATVNAIVASIAANFQAAGKNVTVVDLNTNFPADGLSADGVHPNLTGYTWMASRWYDALVSTYLVDPALGSTALTLSSSVTVAAGGRLEGTGQLGGPLSVAGTLSPGVGIGTLAAGATTLSGTYACELDAGTCDKLAVTGDLTLTGSTLAVTALAPAGATSYVIATYTGSLHGGFASITGLPVGYSVYYDASGKRILIATDYEAWRLGCGLSVSNGTTSQDPDGDGTPNLLEYALGGKPLDARDHGVSVTKIQNVAGTPALTLTVAVRAGASFVAGANQTMTASVGGIVYQIEASQDLAAWTGLVSEVSPALSAGLPAVPAGYEYHTFGTAVPVAGTPQDFLRLRVTASP